MVRLKLVDRFRSSAVYKQKEWSLLARPGMIWL
jgi:hypothetical protein